MAETAQQYLQTAERIGSRLCRDAIWSGTHCNWVGPSMEFVENNWTVVHRSFGPDLYSGTSGIALFLAYLFSATGVRIFRLTAEGALQQALSREHDLTGGARVGFYYGALGVAWSASTAAALFEDQRLQILATALSESVASNDPDPHSTDVVSGSAGAIPVLLSFYRESRRDLYIDSAIRHGRALLGTARKSDRGWSWDTLHNEHDEHLTGFSHGTAGIARALLELYAATGEAEYLVGAEEAFRYESSWYSVEHENWPDLRGLAVGSGVRPTNFGVAWCHGAPGIGLSRIRAWQILGRDNYIEEARVALRTTVRTVASALPSGQYNFSLCHGLCGNAELLLCGAECLDAEEPCMSTTRAVAEEGVHMFHVQNNPWPCGVLGAGEVPGLMLGIAGIGYFYLRLHRDAKPPSILIAGTGEKRSYTKQPSREASHGLESRQPSRAGP